MYNQDVLDVDHEAPLRGHQPRDKERTALPGAASLQNDSSTGHQVPRPPMADLQHSAPPEFRTSMHQNLGRVRDVENAKDSSQTCSHGHPLNLCPHRFTFLRFAFTLHDWPRCSLPRVIMCGNVELQLILTNLMPFVKQSARLLQAFHVPQYMPAIGHLVGKALLVYKQSSTFRCRGSLLGCMQGRASAGGDVGVAGDL